MNIKYNVEKLLDFATKKFSINRKKSKKIIETNRKVNKALEEIDKYRNYSWDQDIEYRNLDNFNKEALYYRGNTITFKEMFSKRDNVAKSLKKMGIKKGDTIPICMSNTPEFVYTIMAASKIGAKAMIFGASFDKEYLKKMLNDCSKKAIIITDDNYEKIKDIVKEVDFEHKIVASLADSLPNGVDPYYDLDKEFKDFSNKANEFKKEDANIFTFADFENYGKDYKGTIIEEVHLDDEFLITFTSGSTKKGLPKQIVHPHRSLITMARFHDSDLSGLPPMKDVRMLAHIPTYSNTDVITSISDPLSQGCSAAMEPIYNVKFHNRSLVINEPNAIPATTSFLLHSAKTFEKEFPGKKLENSYIVIAVGEPTSKGEEKLINKWLRNVKAGTKRVPFPLSPVTLSLGGGDCEHGGIYFTLFHNLRQKASLSKETYGLTPFKCVEQVILDEFGNHITDGRIGHLAAIGPTTMKKYNNNEEATNAFFIHDAYGKKYGDCKAWAHITKKGNIIMHGRMGSEFHLSDGTKVAPYVISENIQKDTKNILSCEVVNVMSEYGTEIPIAHIEIQPDKMNKNMAKILTSIEKRLQKQMPKELLDKLLYRIHSNEESFALTGSGKRSILALEEEGISDKNFKVILEDDIVCLDFNIDKYLQGINQEEKIITKKLVG